MLMYVDNNLVSAQGFSNFPDTFKVVLTGQARAGNDTVSAVFDNLVISQVPEPGSLLLGAMGSLLLLNRRRRK